MGGGLWVLPGRLDDRGGGAGLLLAARGGRSLSLSLSDGQSLSSSLSLPRSRSRSLIPNRSGEALTGGDLGLLGTGEIRGTSCAGAGADRGVGRGAPAAEAEVRGIAEDGPRRGAAEIGVRGRGGAAETGVRERGGAAEAGVRDREGAAE